MDRNILVPLRNITIDDAGLYFKNRLLLLWAKDADPTFREALQYQLSRASIGAHLLDESHAQAIRE